MPTEPRPTPIDEPKPIRDADATTYGDDGDDDNHDDVDGDGDGVDDDDADDGGHADDDEHAEHGARGTDSPPVFSRPRLLASVCD